mmetsp:Transcript_60060/g.128930  ORF Transcript_60060/g.128930 Transcript_60060/m.128930 type:complete len:209 (+) Transcript_60060:3890-4516(+)
MQRPTKRIGAQMPCMMARGVWRTQARKARQQRAHFEQRGFFASGSSEPGGCLMANCISPPSPGGAGSASISVSLISSKYSALSKASASRRSRWRMSSRPFTPLVMFRPFLLATLLRSDPASLGGLLPPATLVCLLPATLGCLLPATDTSDRGSPPPEAGLSEAPAPALPEPFCHISSTEAAEAVDFFEPVRADFLTREFRRKTSQLAP